MIIDELKKYLRFTILTETEESFEKRQYALDLLQKIIEMESKVQPEIKIELPELAK